MKKYMLARGQKRIPIDGIRTVPREGLPPMRQAETVVFEPGMVVETDLDFGTWMTDGMIVRIRETHEPPRPPQPAPMPRVEPPTVIPMPSSVVVDVIKEETAVPPMDRPEIPPDPDMSISTRPRQNTAKKRR